MNIQIQWLGWSSFKLKIHNKIIYLDPFAGNYDETADVVLISHGHADHCNLDVLSKISNSETIVLTSKQNESNVNGIGLLPNDYYIFSDIKFIACHAYNIVRMREPGIPFHPKGFGVGWIIEFQNKKIYFMGDTEKIPEMEAFTNIDVLLIPVSGRYVMDVDEAIETIKMIKPTYTIPMHYGTIDHFVGGKRTRVKIDIDTKEFTSRLDGLTNTNILNHNEIIELI